MGRKALKRLRKRKLKKSVKRPPDDTLTPNDVLRIMMTSSQNPAPSNNAELFNLRMANNMKSQELDNYKKELEAELQKKKDIVNERDKLKKDYEKLEMDFKKQKADDQEREKYSKKTKEIQNQIDTQKMKNENTAKLLEQQQNALKEKMEVGQQLEDLKNQNNQLEIDLFNLTNKKEEIRQEIQKKEQLTHKNKQTQRELDDLKIENETLLKMTEGELTSKALEEAKQLSIDLAVEREHNMYLKQINEQRQKIEMEKLMNPMIPADKMGEMNEDIKNEIKTVYAKQLEYDNSLRKGKMAYAEHEQLEVELANQHKNTINAKINAEKTEKYLENVKNDELNNERIKLMTEELKSKEQSDNNLRQIELHKRLKKINEEKQANEDLLKYLESQGLESSKQLIEKKAAVMKGEKQNEEMQKQIQLTNKNRELKVDYQTKKMFNENRQEVDEIMEGNTIIKQYNDQQEKANLALQAQTEVYNRIKMYVDAYPNCWEKFTRNDTEAATKYNDYTSYSVDELNKVGNDFYNFLDSYDKADWDMS